ncbi:MAG: glycosyltransferase [Magnetococcales bacterium]|nr:glycosyltransferase [Magnetococcales bacterium]
MARLRVLILHPSLTPYRIDLFNALADPFDLTTLFFRSNPVSQSFDQTRLRRQLRCAHGDLNQGIDLFGRQFRWGIGMALRVHRPDVVVVMEYAPSTWMAAWQRFIGRKNFGLLIWTADNVEMCLGASPIRSMARKFLLSHADGLIVYSAAVRDWFVGWGMDHEKMAVCANINDPGRFRTRLREARDLACSLWQRYRLQGRFVFLSVGRLAAIKGVDRILLAFHEVHRLRPETRLVIVGDGVERERLESSMRALRLAEAVLFTGQLLEQELAAWYLLGQVFLLASSFEPYGAVIHEALTAGMPVVCSRVAGGRDLIVEGENGWLFDPWDRDELVVCMMNAMAGRPLSSIPAAVLPPDLMPIAFTDGVAQFIRLVQQTAKQRIHE